MGSTHHPDDKAASMASSVSLLVRGLLVLEALLMQLVRHMLDRFARGAGSAQEGGFREHARAVALGVEALGADAPHHIGAGYPVDLQLLGRIPQRGVVV